MKDFPYQNDNSMIQCNDEAHSSSHEQTSDLMSFSPTHEQTSWMKVHVDTLKTAFKINLMIKEG